MHTLIQRWIYVSLFVGTTYCFLVGPSHFAQRPHVGLTNWPYVDLIKKPYVGLIKWPNAGSIKWPHVSITWLLVRWHHIVISLQNNINTSLILCSQSEIHKKNSTFIFKLNNSEKLNNSDRNKYATQRLSCKIFRDFSYRHLLSLAYFNQSLVISPILASVAFSNIVFFFLQQLQ